MLKSQSLVVYLKHIELNSIQLKILAQPKLDNNILGAITQGFN